MTPIIPLPTMTQLDLFPAETIETAFDASPDTAGQSPIPPSPVQNKSQFHSVLATLTPDRLAQIAAWNKDHTYQQTIELIREKFGANVSRSSLGRFHQRTALIPNLEDTPDTEAAADEILRHAVNPQHKFTEATLHVLQETAFKLSRTCSQNAAHLDQLNRISQILCRQRNTTTRERHAHVQETKCDLRREELDLKKFIATERLAIAHRALNLRASRLPARNFNPNLSPSSDTPTTATPPNSEPLNAQPNQNHVDGIHHSSASDFVHDIETPIFASPCPLPPEVIEKNRLYAQKLRAGKIIFDRSGPYIRDIELPDAPSAVVPGSQTPTNPSTTNQ